MSLSQVISILKARWGLLLGVFVAILSLAIVANILLPKKFTSTASLLIDVKSPDPMIGMVLPAMMSPSYMATQVDLIESERVAIEAINRLGLNKNASMREDWMKETNGIGSFDSWMADLLSRNLKVKPSRESNVISISYEARDPRFAAAMANAFAQAYISVSTELRTDPAQKFETIFEGLANRTRERLEKAQARLSAYQRENGLIATDERMDVEMARLVDLSQQVTMLEGVQSESGSRAAQFADGMPEVLNNSVISALKAELARMQARLEEQLTHRGDAHPQVMDLRAGISTLKERIAAETRKVSGGIGVVNNVNSARVAQAKSALAAQREKVLKMRAQRDEASVMVREVDQLQKAYDVIQSRTIQSGMESQTNHTNVAVVQIATPSSKASSPKVFINILLGVFGGALVALTVVMLRELTDRRVRTQDDVINELNMPLVGSMLKTHDARYSLLSKKKQPWLIRSSQKKLPNPNA